jgi:hypothetical protein
MAEGGGVTGRILTAAIFVRQQKAEECDIVDRCSVRTGYESISVITRTSELSGLDTNTSLGSLLPILSAHSLLSNF